ncbi:MAG TPA: hypothetical protein VFT38_03420 [Vicinamibacteria bacterium]|nr:hypothetical protein [Vicinamibacteria bacterium]
MVKDRRRWIAPGLAVAAAAVVGFMVLRNPAPAVAPSASAAEAPKAPGRRDPDLPRIDLARLDRPRPAAGIGRRDLFDFAAPPPTPPPPVRSAPPMVETPPPVTAPTPPPLSPLNIKYIGAFEGKKGLKVAVLMTDRKEVLTGQAGEVVANRYRIVRIGLESVDVQEVGSEQVRRIPLKGTGN